MLKTRIRAMKEADLAEASVLEKLIYKHSWSEGHFADSLRNGDDCWVLVLDKGKTQESNDISQEPSKIRPCQEKIIGHGVLAMVITDATILNLAIHPDYRRQGLGNKMLAFLLQQARLKNGQTCFLEVRVGNTAAIAMYNEQGFEQVGCRPNYYRAAQGREDALVLQLKL